MRRAGLAALVFGLAAALTAAAQGGAQDDKAQGNKSADYGTPDGLQKLIADKAAGKGVPYILVDVRTPEEFASGHIPTAVNIPNDTILAKPPTRDKAALIIVYCRSGSRSAAAYRALTGAGYTNVVDFGPIGRWKGEIVKP